MNFQHLLETPMEQLNIPIKAFQSPQWSNSKSLSKHLYVPKEAYLCPQGSISKFPMERFKVPNGALQDSNLKV
jgi:hypothetical protein